LSAYISKGFSDFYIINLWPHQKLTKTRKLPVHLHLHSSDLDLDKLGGFINSETVKHCAGDNSQPINVSGPEIHFLRHHSMIVSLAERKPRLHIGKSVSAGRSTLTLTQKSRFLNAKFVKSDVEKRDSDTDVQVSVLIDW